MSQQRSGLAPPSRVRRRTLLAAGATTVLASSSCDRESSWTGARGRVRIATGNPGAVFNQYGQVLAERIHQRMPGVSARALASRGSSDNLEHVAAGRAELAFTLGDAAALAVRGQAPFDRPIRLEAITRLYDSFLQVLVPLESPIREASDLRGARVAVGERRSGTLITVERVLSVAGVSLEQVELAHPTLAEATDELASGEVDALCFVSGVPVRALVDLGSRMGLRALDIGGLVPALVRRYGAQYIAGPLPATPYGLPRTVETVSVKTYFVAAPTVSGDLAYGAAAVIFDDQESIAESLPDVRQPTLSSAIFTEPLDLHPGAERYFRDRDAGES